MKLSGKFACSLLAAVSLSAVAAPVPMDEAALGGVRGQLLPAIDDHPAIRIQLWLDAAGRLEAAGLERAAARANAKAERIYRFRTRIACRRASGCAAL
ncbi:MAG: hypothetical protein SV108_05185 [Pseudomonadota bacterium]|nr:hypothetical protein [Pseudomonadota bacterium]HJO35308.1 hypothetical protein [Gammaproteobacteria bacterium]